jgi:DNA-binding MarR family transcriptional regulator
MAVAGPAMPAPTVTRQELVTQLGTAMQAYQSQHPVVRRRGRSPAWPEPTDLRCLDWLVDVRRSARELSEATGLSSAATTTLIDRLERKGFVRRVAHDWDRRQVLVELTEQGRERVGRFYGPLVSEGSAMLGAYTKDQLAVMLGYLLSITELTDRHRDLLRGG